MTSTNGTPVVVTTAHRGVFFGYLANGIRDSKTAELTEARMCLYWSAETRGVMGLASGGPAKGSKIGPAVPRMTLQDVTAVMDATPEAVTAWQAALWS